MALVINREIRQGEATLSEPAKPNQVLAIVCAGIVLANLDLFIVNVALPNMQGSLGAAHDQITWVLTSYIVAAAIMTPVTGWPSR